MIWLDRFADDLKLSPEQKELLAKLIVCTNCRGTSTYEFSDRTELCWICDGLGYVMPNYMPGRLRLRARWRRK